MAGPSGGLALYPGPLTASERRLADCAIRAGLLARDEAKGLLRAQYYLAKQYRPVEGLLSPKVREELGLPPPGAGAKAFQLLPPRVDLKGLDGPPPPVEPEPADPLTLPTLASTAQELDALFDAYEKDIRDDLAALKSDKSVANELAENAKRFKFPDVEAYWRFLRPLYFRAGFPDPVRTIFDVTKRSATFATLRVGGGVSAKFAQVIKAADDWAFAHKVVEVIRDEVQTMWAWSPRSIDQNNLGMHAIGDALDIDSSANPHLKGPQAKEIDKFLDWRKAKGLYTAKYRLTTVLHDEPTNQTEHPDFVAKEYFEGMKAISDELKRFLEEWLDKASDLRKKAKDAQAKAKDAELRRAKPGSGVSDADVQAARDAREAADKELKDHAEELAMLDKVVANLGGLDAAKRAKKKGILTIPLELFQAFQNAATIDAAVRFGIQYRTAKDSMHVEILVKYPRDPCLDELRKRGFGV